MGLVIKIYTIVLLKTFILCFNKPFSFFVVWLGSENLMFRKNYHRNNYNV
jgi:hypothetical protein